MDFDDFLNSNEAGAAELRELISDDWDRGIAKITYHATLAYSVSLSIQNMLESEKARIAKLKAVQS